MPITSNIKDSIDSALTSGSFSPSFIAEVEDDSTYSFFIKVMGELGHDLASRKSLLTSPYITSNALSNVASLRASIINDDVFKVLVYAKTTIELLQKV